LGWWQRLKQSFWRTAERAVHRLPGVSAHLEREYARVADMVRTRLHPYEGELPTFTRLPEAGVPHQQVLAWMRQLHQKETPLWQAGQVSGTVYHGGEEHAAFLSQVYALHAQSNPLHADLFPSTVKFEAEIVAMTAHLLGATPTEDPDQQIVGTVTSGGTESILLAMKTYRDWARAERGITQPEVIAPVTAHPAFDKAAHLFGMRLVRTPVDSQFRADVEAMRRAITRNTVALVGSAPGYPHGVIDPIEPLAELAQAHRVGLHVDACLGGFILPFIERLGYPVPLFDFRVRGVTSMSVDPTNTATRPKGCRWCCIGVVACAGINISLTQSGRAGYMRRLRCQVVVRARSVQQVGRRWSRWARRATSKPPAASWRPLRRFGRASKQSRNCA
jgi:sphinganine-1-phosphate aldolase